MAVSVGLKKPPNKPFIRHTMKICILHIASSNGHGADLQDSHDRMTLCRERLFTLIAYDKLSSHGKGHFMQPCRFAITSYAMEVHVKSTVE